MRLPNTMDYLPSEMSECLQWMLVARSPEDTIHEVSLLLVECAGEFVAMALWSYEMRREWDVEPNHWNL